MKATAEPAKAEPQRRARGGPAMWITRTSINQPVFATMVSAGALL
jgi:hypothetical protein